VEGSELLEYQREMACVLLSTADYRLMQHLYRSLNLYGPLKAVTYLQYHDSYRDRLFSSFTEPNPLVNSTGFNEQS
jgi:hypothetical protein